MQNSKVALLDAYGQTDNTNTIDKKNVETIDQRISAWTAKNFIVFLQKPLVVLGAGQSYILQQLRQLVWLSGEGCWHIAYACTHANQ